MNARPLALAVTLFTPLASCAPEGGGDPVPEVAELELEATPSVRIGSLDDPDRALVAVGDLAVGPAGRLWIGQSSDALVRVFTPEGEPVRRVGGRGEGPGEFAMVSALGFFADTLWVSDRRQRRVSLFDTAGTHLESVRHPELTGLPEGSQAGFGAPLAGGRVLMTTSAVFESDLVGSDFPFPLRVVSRDGGSAVDVATLYLAHDRAILTEGTASGFTVSVFTQPWGDVTLWTTTPDGRAVVLVDRRIPEPGATAHYRLTRVDVQGDTAFSVEVPYSPIPVPQAEIDSLFGRARGATFSEADLRRIIFLPESLPPASDVVAGRDGTIWVAREAIQASPTRIWDRFGPDGRLEARVTIPAGLDMLDATRDAVWGEETDDLDVPYVVRYRVVEPG